MSEQRIRTENEAADGDLIVNEELEQVAGGVGESRAKGAEEEEQKRNT